MGLKIDGTNCATNRRIKLALTGFVPYSVFPFSVRVFTTTENQRRWRELGQGSGTGLDPYDECPRGSRVPLTFGHCG